jgi:EpsI family protein
VSDNNLSRRHMIIGGALLATSAAALVRKPHEIAPRMAKGSLDKMIPTRIGDWAFETSSGLVQAPADTLSDSLYNDILTRVYVAQNKPPIMLLIAYGNTQNGMLQLHRPEVCYPAGGYHLSDTKLVSVNVDPLPVIPGHFFTAEGAARTEQVLYLTRIGKTLPTSWSNQRTAVIAANLHGEIPDGILVRVSSIQPDAMGALPVLNQFIKSLTQGVNPVARKLLIGV